MIAPPRPTRGLDEGFTESQPFALLPHRHIATPGSNPVAGDDRPRGDVFDNVLDSIGRTPLVRFARSLDRTDVDLFVKMESRNPGGSAKDRPARAMIQDAIDRGLIGPGSVVIESTSGNMGIGLAQVCRYHSMHLICVVDPNAQPQNLDIIRALGGRIDMVTQPVDGTYLNARIKRVAELLDRHRGSFWPNQYANPINPRSHQHGTIAEIDDHFGDTLDYLFVATSSTGTAQGCQNLLRARGRRCQVVAVDAVGSVLFGGRASKRHIPGLGAGRVPPLARGQTFAAMERVSDLDCVVGCRRVAQREATLIGGSAGGVIEAVRRWQDRLAGRTVAAVLHDSGTRYLDTVFNDRWVAEKLSTSPERLGELMDAAPSPPSPPQARAADELLATDEPRVADEPCVADEPRVAGQSRAANNSSPLGAHVPA